MNRPVLKTALIIYLVIAVIFSTGGRASGITGSTNVLVSVDSTQLIGEYTFPWPFSDYKLSLRVRVATNPSLPIRYSSVRDLISIGESVTLQLDASPTTSELNSWLLVRLLKGSEVIRESTLEVPKIQMGVPGIQKTPAISIPVLPLHGVGIPLTIGFALRAEITTAVPLVVRAERLTPSTYRGIITEDVLSLRSPFMKGDGVGGRIILDKAGLNVDGRLFVSLTIIELPLVKYEFPPLSLYALSSESSVNRELLKLRTPLSVSLSAMKELAVLGDSLSLSGRVSPPAGGIKIDLVARKLGGYWFTARSTLTAPDGSFAISWSPTEAGEYEMRAYHGGGDIPPKLGPTQLKPVFLGPLNSESQTCQSVLEKFDQARKLQ
jgi:hypothetical protein